MQISTKLADAESIRSTQSVTLPFDWDVDQRGRSGHATFELSFPRPREHSDLEPYMLFLSAISNAYVIELNEVEVAAAGTMNDGGERWAAKHPVGVTFPATLLRDDNRLIIRLRADAGRRAGLTPLLLGPLQVIEPIRAQAYRSRFIPTLAATLFALSVSGFSLLLWLQHRDPLFAWASLGELIWAVIVFDVILEWTPFPWPAWGYSLIVLLGVWIVVLHKIVAEVFGTRPRSETTAIRVIAATVVPAIAVTVVVGSPTAVEIWRAVSAITVAALAIRLLLEWRRTPSVERALLAAGIVMLFLAAVFDAFAAPLFDQRLRDTFWGEYAGTFLGITILWAVSKRFQLARSASSSLQSILAARVEQKEQELRATHERLSAMEQDKAAHSERERILRDMHDGVGANLFSAMRQLESGAPIADAVATTLRDSLDRLKLSIDAMNLPTGDINALLASLRYRLHARIEQAGVILEWDVAELPQWRSATDLRMRKLQFLMYESISIAVSDYQASTLRLSAHAFSGAIELVLSDNGRCTAERALSSGDKECSLHEYASAIDAALAIEKQEGNTLVRLRIRI